MKKKTALYAGLIAVSILLIVFAMTVLDNTKLAAPVVIVLSVYLFVGSIIKLCRMNEKLKGIVSGVVESLFWLP